MLRIYLKSLVAGAMICAGALLSGCNNTTANKVVELNRQYADCFDQTTTQEEFLEQQTAYSNALADLSRRAAEENRAVTDDEQAAIAQSFALVDSSMIAAQQRLFL